MSERRKGRRMYNVAVVTYEKCVAKKGCRLCIMYCPKADCILLDTKNMVAKVVTDICKGCELCKVVCDAAKHQAIEMLAMGADGKLLHKKAEAAGLGRSFAQVRRNFNSVGEAPLRHAPAGYCSNDTK